MRIDTAQIGGDQRMGNEMRLSAGDIGRSHDRFCEIT
jgi:hypothetical protein